MESADLLLIYHPSPRLLLDLDPYGGFDPLGMFPPFLKRIADVLVPCLSVVFRWRVRLHRLFPCLLGTGLCHPYAEWSTVHLCC